MNLVQFGVGLGLFLYLIHLCLDCKCHSRWKDSKNKKLI